MPTKRTRRTRNLEAGITPEAVHHFRAALPLQDRYLDCVEEKRVCPRKDHCPECLQYLEHARQLRRELKLKLWEDDPLTTDCPLRDELEKHQ